MRLLHIEKLGSLQDQLGQYERSNRQIPHEQPRAC